MKTLLTSVALVATIATGAAASNMTAGDPHTNSPANQWVGNESQSVLPDDADVILCGHVHRQQILTKRVLTSNHQIPIIFSGSVERTSFAEKDESKGFYHLNFSVNAIGEWTLRNYKFITLPTRPMEDIYLDSITSFYEFESFLKTRLRETDKNSIVRFIADRSLTEDTLSLLRSDYLRQLLPSSMNIQLSPRLFGRD